MLVRGSLSKRLRLLRESRHLSQQRLADFLGLPRGTYTHYELGRRTPDLELLMRIADLHRVSLDYLIGYTDRKPTLSEWFTDHPEHAENVAPVLYSLDQAEPKKDKVADSDE
jgi:transcriptional regulator with XRE-family HTH domain